MNDLADNPNDPKTSGNEKREDWAITSPGIRFDDSVGDKQTSADDWQITQVNPDLSPPAACIESKPEFARIDGEAITTTPNIRLPESEDWAASSGSIPVPQNDSGWAMPQPVFRKSEGVPAQNLGKAENSVSFSLDDTGAYKTTPNVSLDGVSSPESAPASETAPRAAEPKKGSAMVYVVGGLLGVGLLAVLAAVAAYFLYFGRSKAPELVERRNSGQPDSAAGKPPLTTAAAAGAPAAEVDYKGKMVLVPAGVFTMGSDSAEPEAAPAHSVDLPAYYIDKYEVTNAQYKVFADASGRTYPADNLEPGYFTKRPDAPVIGVPFDDAKAYAEWAGKRLPTEEEWEKAASWDSAKSEKRDFPWGAKFEAGKAAFGTKTISDVGKFAAGASPSGAMDMAGNAAEWTGAFFKPYPGSSAQNPEFGEKNRVVRGGHFASKSGDSLKTTKRIYVPVELDLSEKTAPIGFRCAVSADDEKLKDSLQNR
jgi:formylglycine-generating enzyme required for sulfatase activity